ncbi:MAG: imelysin family protein [Saprospiraceae bacterium]|nr:imelysin family protein [Saprospiraceae bacterium]
MSNRIHININNRILFQTLVAFFSLTILCTACQDKSSEDDEGPTETDYTDHLTNQMNEVILPTMVTYQSRLSNLGTAVDAFTATKGESTLANLRSAYQEAYLAYQAAAVHNYFATINQSLVGTSNLFPIEVSVLEDLIETESYNFSTTAQERANGFPALDYMLYGPADVLSYFNEDAKRLAFLGALVDDMQERADRLVSSWSGSLQSNFINNGGTQLGSSISVQLNESLIYYEDHIRENKVGIPIGRLGPNDSPIPADATKVEGYYQSLFEGNENFTLALLKAAIEEMEDLYLGNTSKETNGQGYDDLLIAREQSSINEDIKAQFNAIYSLIASRNSISGDESLYDEIQALVTLYKSDLFPVLNVQDADGANDGD